MKIYTGTGDKGRTGLFSGERISKAHLRIDAYGDVDELNSILGAVAHNAGQLSAAVVLVGSTGVFYYMPYLLLAGLLFGSVTGFPIQLILERRHGRRIPLS